MSKHDLRIESYGTVDELNAHLGLLRDQLDIGADQILHVQNCLFVIGSNLAKDPDKEVNVPKLAVSEITQLEMWIDEMENGLEPLTAFILPGGHPVVSQAHVCRCVCRRAERRVVALAESQDIDPVLVKYLNRLSDYLFVFGRFIGKEFGATEVKWNAPK